MARVRGAGGREGGRGAAVFVLCRYFDCVFDLVFCFCFCSWLYFCFLFFDFDFDFIFLDFSHAFASVLCFTL